MEITEDLIRAAALRFEKERGVSIEGLEHFLSGSPAESNSLTELTEALSEFVDVNYLNSSELVSSAVWALGKTNQNCFSKLYLKIMKSSQNINQAACYQAAIAYENLGHIIFYNSADVSNPDSFLREINIYLNSNGV